MPFTWHQIEAIKTYQDMFEGSVNSERIVQASHKADSTELKERVDTVVQDHYSLYSRNETKVRADMLTDKIIKMMHKEK